MKRNSIFFYLSFFTAGTQGILTQLFLKNYYPSNKEILLPLTLILGALAYIGGVLVSGKFLKASPYLIKIMFVINVTTFMSLMLVKSALLYILFYIIACFSCNFIFNFCDHIFLKTVHEDVSRHIKVMLAYQMLAYILSPVFFSINSRNTLLNLFVISLIAIIIGHLSFFKFTYQDKEDIRLRESTSESPKPFSLSEKLFILYVVIFLALVSMAISMITYFVSEYYMLSNYALKSGVLLMLMSISAGIAVIVYKNPAGNSLDISIKKLKYILFRPHLQIVIIVVTFLLSILLLIKLSDSFLYIALILLVMGIGYGLFLSSSRKFAGIVSTKENKPKLLSVFNNLQSIALLLGYSISALIWGINTLLRSNYYVLLLMAILTMLVIEIVLVLLWVWITNKTNDRIE